MQNQTDLSTITDINQLKAMAYDQLSALNQAQHNIQLIEARIAKVEKEPVAESGQQLEPATTTADAPAE